MSDKCPYCFQPINLALLNERKKEMRGRRISRALQYSQENGVIVGRPRKIDYEEAKTMREGGKTIGEIAKSFGCTDRAVIRALKK